jgi:hypothetical protein
VSTYSCAQLHDVAPELALGVLGGAERAEAVIHVNECARCQALVNELTMAADALPLLAPELEPPPGFEERVLATGHARRRRNLRRWVASIAVAAAAAAILSITIVRVVDAGSETTRAIVHGVPAEARMVGAGDRPAGWAYVTDRYSVAVALTDYGVPSGNYDVAVHPRNGPSVTIGSMAIDAAGGSWTGRSSVPLGAGSEITLVSEDGNPACHGTVTPRE